MPKKLTFDPNALHPFWYKQNVSPPKDMEQWDRLITERGRATWWNAMEIEEVAQWYFEVWNEPNIDFWVGDSERYDLLRFVRPHGAGGEAGEMRDCGWAVRQRRRQRGWTSSWRTATQNNVPVDFVSTHVYGNDSAEDVFGTHEKISRNEMVCRAVKKVHEQIGASAYPGIPLIWSEYNAAYDNTPAVTDSAYMGPYLANTIRECDGLTAMMSYWTFSDVFEEQGVVKTPFYGGFGLLAEDSIPKASLTISRCCTAWAMSGWR